MNTRADKTQENKSRSVANEVSHKQSAGNTTFQFVDNRPEAVAQRKLQDAINNSPRVQQLKSYQEMANSPQVKQLRDTQAIADNLTSQTAQRKENSEEETLQGKFESLQKKPNNTGLPDTLKTGAENLSGMSLDDVKVHYNSVKPAQLQAHAYAEGTDIHLGSGQEKHLPHEAWHVVQQKQGRVKPTVQMKGKVNVNDDAGLEKEADVMGAKANSTVRDIPYTMHMPVMQQQKVIQRVDDTWNNGWADTALGRTLTAGINGGGQPAEILDQLMANFRTLGGQFTYDKTPGDHMAFLGGTMRGDCGTLARAFKAIGEGYYQINGIDTTNYADSWTQAGPTPYGGNQPDCDGGTSWIFGSHTWATHGGTVYDLLFCVNILAPRIAEVREVRSIFFPLRSYSIMADGSITYPLQLAPAPAYCRVPPDLASQVIFLLSSAPAMLLRALGRLLFGGLKALVDGIGWIVNKVKSWVGSNDDDNGFGALGGLGKRE